MSEGVETTHAKLIHEALLKLENRLQTEISGVEAKRERESQKLKDQLHLMNETLSTFVRSGKSDYQGNTTTDKRNDRISTVSIKNDYESTAVSNSHVKAL